MAAILEKFKSIITSSYEKVNVSNLNGGKIEGANKTGNASSIAEVSRGGAKATTEAGIGKGVHLESKSIRDYYVRERANVFDVNAKIFR